MCLHVLKKRRATNGISSMSDVIISCMDCNTMFIALMTRTEIIVHSFRLVFCWLPAAVADLGDVLSLTAILQALCLAMDFVVLSHDLLIRNWRISDV